jgi:hypothetical protein
MLQDAVFARASWLAGQGHEATAIAFLKASALGWSVLPRPSLGLRRLGDRRWRDPSVPSLERARRRTALAVSPSGQPRDAPFTTATRRGA